MPISKKDNLHNLIKSLTKNEKKYLRDFLKNQKETKSYLELFNKLDHQSKHQKDSIKNIFDKKQNQLPVIKTYLTNLIQKILQNFHRHSSPFDIVQNNFLEINILLQKELFDLAEFQINKTIILCHKHQLAHQLLQALEWKKRFLTQKFGAFAEEIKDATLDLIKQQRQILLSLNNLYDYQDLQASFYDHFQQGTGLNQIIYTNLHKNPLIIDEKQPLTLEAKLLQAHLNFRLHLYKDKNLQAANQSLQKGIRMLELSPNLIQQNPQYYLALLHQKLQLLLQIDSPTELAQTLLLIRRAPQDFNFDAKKPYLRRYIMEAYSIELNLYQKLSQIPQALDLIKNIEAEYHDLNSPALRQWRAVMDHAIAKFYLQINEDSLALRKAKEILSAEYSQREEDIYLQTLLLIIQIALKQKNNLLLKQILEKFQSSLKTHKNQSHLEKHLLQFLFTYSIDLQFPRRHGRLTKKMAKIRQAANRKTPPHLAEFLLWLNDLVLTEIQS